MRIQPPGDVARLIELEKDLNTDIDGLVDHKRLVQRVIDALTDARRRDMLTWRYFNHWTWDKIAIALDCECMQAWR